MNPRINKKDKGLIRGGMRRVFARSELRLSVIAAAIIAHTNSSRVRVKTWVRCNGCRKPIPKSYVVVDHILPVIKIEEHQDQVGWDEFIDRLWCSADNLQVLCEPCHLRKSLDENKLRREYKKRVKSTLTRGDQNEE